MQWQMENKQGCGSWGPGLATAVLEHFHNNYWVHWSEYDLQSTAEQGEGGPGGLEWTDLSLKLALASVAYCSFNQLNFKYSVKDLQVHNNAQWKTAHFILTTLLQEFLELIYWLLKLKWPGKILVWIIPPHSQMPEAFGYPSPHRFSIQKPQHGN